MDFSLTKKERGSAIGRQGVGPRPYVWGGKKHKKFGTPLTRKGKRGKKGKNQKGGRQKLNYGLAKSFFLREKGGLKNQANGDGMKLHPNGRPWRKSSWVGEYPVGRRGGGKKRPAAVL